ncbi:hypothetical protein NO2_1432 [Candidatus Termititenax persephonae]|uniref:Uncharacterized protein n=1 Tax=Candidatus Termititenax persephonae TaxID=2218525 RepID=A0A388TJD3_9BACT|nr:hypothetical protein NO2_1432 [Candidatus Termititenax persephonae]
MKANIDKAKRKSLIKNFKALAFLTMFLLPFTGNAKNIVSKSDKKEAIAVWG